MCSRKKAPILPPVSTLPSAVHALQTYYDAKVLPSEDRHLFRDFYTPGFTQAELEGKPIILLLGQYSVGKTSMIEYLCSGKYPGAEIGPEPTTDIFAHIQYNKDPVQIDGQTLAHDKNYPLKGLEMFGDPFLNKLRSTNFDSELLQYVSILDTPGILAGKKQTDARGYDFAAVISFLAERVDKIFLMFDANKVDLSDEYRDVIKSLDGHSEKVRIVLNKADMMKPRELIHVRGALMWALGKIFTTPEVPKVYIGSFWKYVSLENQMSKTMKEDTDALVKEICELVHTCRGRRINDVVRRAKSVRIHCYLMDTIRRSQLLFFNMPTAVTRKKLARHFAIVERRYRVVHSDMPSEEAFQAKALKTEGSMWKKIDSFDMKLLNSFLNDDITAIIAVANREKQEEVNFTIKERTEKPPDDETDWKTAKTGSKAESPGGDKVATKSEGRKAGVVNEVKATTPTRSDDKEKNEGTDQEKKDTNTKEKTTNLVSAAPTNKPTPPQSKPNENDESKEKESKDKDDKNAESKDKEGNDDKKDEKKDEKKDDSKEEKKEESKEDKK